MQGGEGMVQEGRGRNITGVYRHKSGSSKCPDSPSLLCTTASMDCPGSNTCLQAGQR